MKRMEDVLAGLQEMKAKHEADVEAMDKEYVEAWTRAQVTLKRIEAGIEMAKRMLGQREAVTVPGAKGTS